MTKKTIKKILIVEDDKDFLSILKIKFTNEGFFVITATDGQSGIDAAEKEKPDLIFSDILMPKMGGVEMARKIREFNKNIPIIFFTNIDMEKSGEFEYLIKSNTKISEIIARAKAKLGMK